MLPAIRTLTQIIIIETCLQKYPHVNVYALKFRKKVLLYICRKKVAEEALLTRSLALKYLTHVAPNAPHPP